MNQYLLPKGSTIHKSSSTTTQQVAAETTRVKTRLNIATAASQRSTDLESLQIAHQAAFPDTKDLENWTWAEFRLLYDMKLDSAKRERHYNHTPTEYDIRTWNNARRLNPVNQDEYPDAGPLGRPINK